MVSYHQYVKMFNEDKRGKKCIIIQLKMEIILNKIKEMKFACVQVD